MGAILKAPNPQSSKSTKLQILKTPNPQNYKTGISTSISTPDIRPSIISIAGNFSRAIDIIEGRIISNGLVTYYVTYYFPLLAD